MIRTACRARLAQRGVVLVSSLLLLIVVTIIALSMFRSFGMQEKIAGNMREKQRALQAAESAQVFAEVWLQGNSTEASIMCSGTLNGNIGEGQICANKLSDPTLGVDVTSPPYILGGNPTGVTFLPTGISQMSTTTSATGNPSYFGKPTFYISDLGASVDPTIPSGEVYQVDAYGYGTNANTVAVVESTYVVYTSSSNKGTP